MWNSVKICRYNLQMAYKELLYQRWIQNIDIMSTLIINIKAETAFWADIFYSIISFSAVYHFHLFTIIFCLVINILILTTKFPFFLKKTWRHNPPPPLISISFLYKSSSGDSLFPTCIIFWRTIMHSLGTLKIFHYTHAWPFTNFK